MSKEELRQQADTINTMAVQIQSLNKYMKFAPLFGVLGTLLSGAFALGVFLYKYDVNVVKQPQFNAEKNSRIKGDSLTNVRVDTTNKRIDNLPNLRFTGVTQHKDKYGNITYRNVN